MRASTPEIKGIGSFVRTRRFELGMSQRELAEKAGMHPAYLSQIEHGLRRWPAKYAEALAIALDCSIEELSAIALSQIGTAGTRISDADIDRIADAVVARLSSEAPAA